MGRTVILIGATAPVLSSVVSTEEKVPSRDGAVPLEQNGGESAGARTALLRIGHPRAGTRWLSVANKAARFGRDAYSDAVHPGLTIRPAQTEAKGVLPGEEGAMDWVACVGIDWGDKEHAYEIRGREGACGGATIGSSSEEVHEWVRGLRERFPTGTIIVAFEHGRWSLIYALMVYEFLALVAINPRASKAYRDSLRLSGASSDESDAALLCDFALKHLSELRVWQPDDAVTRKMRLLVESRRTLVDQRTSLTHTLADTLKQYYPQALQWFRGETSPLLRAFLARWPTLEQMRTASSEEVTAVMRAQRCRKVSAAAQALLEKIRTAVALTGDKAVIDGYSLYAQSLVAIIDPLESQIERYDQVIAAAWATHPDRNLFDSLPGAGKVMAPRLAVAFGRDRSRYGAPEDLQCYSGIAPVIEQSGKQRWVHARWGYPKFLHQTFHEFAQASIPFSPWAKAVYQEHRDRGAGHHETIRALAFRWIRIVFRLWKTGDLYDEQRHLDTLKKNQSPIARRLAA
jgi:transposase